ncbi:MAG: prepilin-type N-terminal cleavage/methylation domain-containing protein [Polyangiales bacterium]
MVSPRRHHSREAGLTLLELMIVVAVIAIVAALAAPSVGAAAGERRSNETALDIVRLARRGRSEAVGYGRAHLLQFTAGANGQFALFRGDSNRCNNANWAGVVGAGCTAANTACRDLVSGDVRSTPGQQIVISSEDGAAVDICFEPTGRVLWRRAGLFSDRQGGPMTGGGVRFNIVRNGGDGVTRRILVPLGADARVLL